jgi:transcriptional regulator with XRE-family HTH domain
MLGDTIRAARIRKNLTQARLAELAGVSRRHLAALEKGANVSVSILQRVASVLELTEIQLGDLSLRSSEERPVNVALLTDTIREARAEAGRAQATLARAEGLLGIPARTEVTSSFPKMPVRRMGAQRATVDGIVHERPEWTEITIAGEIRHGQAVDETRKERVSVPRELVEQGEVVFRARGEAMQDQGIADGDLVVAELRPRGRAANGELVIGRIGTTVYIGRWWTKHGRKALLSSGLSEVTIAPDARSLKVVAAINQIVRL